MKGRGHTSEWVVPLILAMVCAAAPARATLRESIEWAVADSDVVVRGRLAGVTREAPAGEIGWATVDIEVLETIKGAAAGRVTVRCSLPDGRFDIDHWQGSGGGERVVFLVKSSRRTRDQEVYALHPLAFREDGWTLSPPQNRPTGTRGGGPPAANRALAYDIEFRTLRDEAQALAGVRKAVQEEPRAGEGGRTAVLVEAPPVVEALRDLPDGRLVLKVPLDGRVERLAQAWASDPQRRHAALAVLTRLKSDRNAELLKAYLNDPFFIRGTTAGKAATWHHDDRLSAYEALRRWGVDVPKPDIEMPGDAYRPATRPTAAVAAGLVLLAGAVAGGLFAVRRRRAARRLRHGTPATAPGFLSSLFDALAVTLLLLAIAAAVLWRTSWSAVHELTFSTAAARHWVSGFRGRLQWVRIAGWEGRVAPAYARFDLNACPIEPWTHDGVQATASGYRHGFSRLDGTVAYRGRTFAKPLKYAVREAPGWLPAAVLAVIPLLRGASLLAGVARRRRRRARQRCQGCGYDLRGGHDRCPECGQVATLSAAAAKAAP